MSDSYRKNAFGNWHVPFRSNMKGWRTQENKRLRHASKQLINTCLDFDAIVLPDIDDFDTIYGSPRDGKLYPTKVPALNQCEVDRHTWLMQGTRLNWINNNFIGGHFKDCTCYCNKKNYYWKRKRK